MSHQDSGSIWDHSRRVATNLCLGSLQDVSIDEWNFWISDFGIVHAGRTIIVGKQWSCCNENVINIWLTLNDVVERHKYYNINKGQSVYVDAGVR